MKNNIIKGRVFLKRLRRFIWTTILGGVIVVLPLTLLFIVLRMIYNFIFQFVEPLSRIFNFEKGIQAWIADLLAFLVIIATFFFIGLVIRTRIGKNIFATIENTVLMKFPFYGTLRDTVQSLFGKKRTPFQKVVLCDVFGNGVLMTGFVSEELPNGNYSVFVPTGPNPTNGFIFHMRPEQLQFVDVKPEDAMRTIIGVGVGSDILFK